MIQLPWYDEPHWQYTTVIDGIATKLIGDFIEDQGWFLSLEDALGNRYLSQRRISPFNVINNVFTPPELPQGSFLVIGPSRQDLDRDSFKNGFQLAYVTREEAALLTTALGLDPYHVTTI